MQIFFRYYISGCSKEILKHNQFETKIVIIIFITYRGRKKYKIIHSQDSIKLLAYIFESVYFNEEFARGL